MPASETGIKQPAVFFDRDGTLMTEVDYCGHPDHVSVFPGVREALLKLKTAGYKNIIITNQSGIGRGYYTEEQYHLVHAELLQQLGDGLIDGAYFCPAAPEENSPRRKPSPAMALAIKLPPFFRFFNCAPNIRHARLRRRKFRKDGLGNLGNHAR